MLTHNSLQTVVISTEPLRENERQEARRQQRRVVRAGGTRADALRRRAAKCADVRRCAFIEFIRRAIVFLLQS